MEISQSNKTCYCKSPLTQYNHPGGDHPCRNCAKSIPNDEQHLYPCLNGQCLYRQTCAQTYLHCAGCYQSSDNGQSIESADTEFIYKKLSHALDTISLVYIIHSHEFIFEISVSFHINHEQYTENHDNNREGNQ